MPAPEYLAVGLLRRPHGVRGDLLFQVYSDFPERIRPGVILYLGEERQPLKITRRKPHNDGMVLGFEGLHTPEEAARFTGKVAFVPAQDRPPLPEGEYYHHQILGLQVEDETGQPLGQVTEILETGANDVYVVRNAEGREVLLPALKQVLLEINLPQGRMRVHLLPGLMEEDGR